MASKNYDLERTPIVNGILWFTALHLAVAVAVFLIYHMQGNDAGIQLFFNYQGGIFFMACAAAELGLAWIALQQFSAGEPMRIAWLLIMLASFYRFIGYFFSKILSVESPLNPGLLAYGRQDSAFYSACKDFGLFVSGPVSMAVLAAGLFQILRILRRLGMLARLRNLDYLLVAAVAAFTLRQAYEIVAWLRVTPPPYGLYKILAWSSDPLLSILLLEAIFIRRAASTTGWGLLTKSWGAFSLGIALTSLGDVGLWATTNHNYIPYPYSAFTWYIWFLASAAYALGPAFQVEACRRALREAAQVPAKPPTAASLTK